MDIAELRSKLDNIAAALAEQDVQQEDIAIEEEQVEEVEEGFVVGAKVAPEEEGPDQAPGVVVKVTGDKVTVKFADGSMEEFSQDELFALPDDLKVGEEVEEEAVAEEEVEETVEVPVAALAELMQLAGYSNYADKLAEYENEPDEDYSDTEDQMIGLSGGLNGPKKMYPASAPGDNPMDQEPREIEEDAIDSVEESLYKSYKAFLEEAEIAEDSTSMVGYAPKGTTIDPKTGRPVPPKSDGPKVKAEPGTAPPGTKIDPKTGKITVPKGSGPFIKNL